MNKNIIVSLLSVRLVQLKLTQLEISNLDYFKVVKLLKFKTKKRPNGKC